MQDNKGVGRDEAQLRRRVSRDRRVTRIGDTGPEEQQGQQSGENKQPGQQGGPQGGEKKETPPQQPNEKPQTPAESNGKEEVALLMPLATSILLTIQTEGPC